MSLQILSKHKERLTEIYKKISLIPGNEASFVNLENLFYEVLFIAREHNEEIEENDFLSDFKQIEANEYKLTQDKYHKSKQRERFIKQFKNSFKAKLHSWLKKPLPVIL
ncbi:MAG TPA: hypothetical protein VM935_18510 [Chitinophagaceae bacterium]|nr:hypothetical protein [Chitinophagaceae bacterium]